MVNMMNLVPGEWESYADEATHYCYVRCLDGGSLYEAVCVRVADGTDLAHYLHQVFFLEEWSEAALVELLNGFGYASMDEFVKENSPTGADEGFVYKKDGAIDRAASPAWIIDLMYVANLMADAAIDEARLIPVEEANRLAADAIGRTVNNVEG